MKPSISHLFKDFIYQRMPPRSKNTKPMFGSEGVGNSLVSNYLNDINLNTITKKNVKSVEDIQLIIGYFNHVIADIQAKKKKL